MKKKYSIAVALALILVGMAVRLLPHPANFTPLAAIALFSGVYLPRRFALVVPLAVMVASDALIGFHNLVLFTWGSFALIGVIGWWVQKHKHVTTVIGGALAGSLLFYLVTNWAVMQFGTMYPHTISGLLGSYAAGIPFFRNMLLGDLFYTSTFFGAYELAERLGVRIGARAEIR